MKPAAAFLTIGICLSLSVAAYADTTGPLNCTPFPTPFNNGQGGPTPVECPAFAVPGATLTGVKLTYAADYQFGLSATNTVVVTFTLAGPANVTWEPTAPLSLTGGPSAPPVPPGVAHAITGVTAAAFAAPFTVNISSTVTAGSVATSAGGVSVTYTYGLLVPVTLTCPSNSATAGVPYNSALVATGLAPYVFTIPLGLPNGLSLEENTGAITGTPTTIGLFTFTSQVLSGAQAVTAECRITVQPAPPEGLVLDDTLVDPPWLRGGGSPVTVTSTSSYWSALATRFRITGAPVTLSHFDLAMSTPPSPNNLTISIYRDGIGVPGQGDALGELVASTTLVNVPYVCVPGLVAGSPDLFVNQVGNNVCNAPGPPRNNIPIVRGTMPGNVLLTPGDYWLALSSVCSPNFCPVWYITASPGKGVAARWNTTNQWGSVIDAPFGMRLYGAAAPGFHLPTPAGTNVKVEAADVDGTGNYNVSVTFDSVTSPGVTTIAAIKAVDQVKVKTAPLGYAHGASEVLFDVSTTAPYSGVSVSVEVNRDVFPITDPALFHYELDEWKDVTEFAFQTASRFTISNKGGGSNALSPFALFRKIDTTPPVLVPTLTGTGPANGWYRGNVSVGWSVGDPESGIASQTDCAPRTLTADSAGTTITCSATNREGLTSSVPVTVKIDKTAPGISGMPAAGCSLWPPNGKLVQVATVTAADAMSGIDTLSVAGTSNEPGNAKNPDIVITPIGGGGYAVQLRADRSGNGSGRTYTLTARATDRAGSVATATATCTVPHDNR